MGTKVPFPPTSRALAEAKLANGPAREAPVWSDDELLHELQVRQIEPERQVDSLRQVQVALEESRDRYFDLYEYSPGTYLRLTDTGLVAAGLASTNNWKCRWPSLKSNLPNSSPIRENRP
jgi:hypothetical protein